MRDGKSIERRKIDRRLNNGRRAEDRIVYPPHESEQFKRWLDTAINNILDRFKINLTELKEHIEYRLKHGDTN